MGSGGRFACPAIGDRNFWSTIPIDRKSGPWEQLSKNQTFAWRDHGCALLRQVRMEQVHTDGHELCQTLDKFYQYLFVVQSLFILKKCLCTRVYMEVIVMIASVCVPPFLPPPLSPFRHPLSLATHICKKRNARMFRSD